MDYGLYGKSEPPQQPNPLILILLPAEPWQKRGSGSFEFKKRHHGIMGICQVLSDTLNKLL